MELGIRRVIGQKYFYFSDRVENKRSGIQAKWISTWVAINGCWHRYNLIYAIEWTENPPFTDAVYLGSCIDPYIWKGKYNETPPELTASLLESADMKLDMELANKIGVDPWMDPYTRTRKFFSRAMNIYDGPVINELFMEVKFDGEGE